MLAFTIAHLSVVVLRFREPQRERPYRIPFSIRVRGGSLPLPAVLGALLSAAGWVSVVVLHTGARYVGLALAARRARALRRLSPDRRQPAAAARHDPRGGAAPRGAARRVRLAAGADLRQPARRRHRPDGGPARRRGARRAGGGGRDDRGDLGLRGADVAADRRAPARAADQARAGGAAAREGRRGGVRRRPRRRRRWCARAAPARRSCARRSGAGWRRSCSRPRSPRACAAVRSSAAPAGRSTTTSARSPSTCCARPTAA